MIKLSDRDKRALKLGGAAVAAILLLSGVMVWLDSLRQVRETIAVYIDQLEMVNPSEAKAAGLRSIVPVLEMPVSEEKQKVLFRNKLNEQLKASGVKCEPLQVIGKSKPAGVGIYKISKIRCKGKCKFGQFLDFIVKLKENPYLVGIEQMQIKCDSKSQDTELDMILTTYVR